MTYQPGIPTGNVELDVDYQNLQTNFQQLDTQFRVNHVPFSNTSGTPPAGINGYHTNVNFVPFTVVPPATLGFGQLLSQTINDGYAIDQALYWLSGGGGLLQLTSNLVPVPSTNFGTATNGRTFLPGGFILQWGRVNSTVTNTLVTQNFDIAFKDACYFVICQPFCNASNTVVPPSSGSTIAVSVNATKFDRTKFSWLNITSSGAYTGFFWVALGH